MTATPRWWEGAVAIRSFGSRWINRFARGKRGVYASALEARIDRLLDRLQS